MASPKSTKNASNKYSIEMDDVIVSYGSKKVIYGISFKVEQGSILGLIGGSGAGKSTLVRVMTGQLPPTKGSAKTAGFDIKKDPRNVRLRIGYVPQLEELSLYYQFGIIDNAKFFGRNFGLSDTQIEERCLEYMSILGLDPEEFLKKNVGRLSGGEKKRVSIIIGLINNPEVLFLDEPTTGLDPHLRIEVLNFLYRVNQQLGTTVVLISHDLECVDYCNYVGVVQKGYLVDFGKPREMVESLPNKGQMAVIKFDHLNPALEDKLRSIPAIKYYLHGGRNVLKISYDDRLALYSLIDDLTLLGLQIESITFDGAVFLDYFRIMSQYRYSQAVTEQQKEKEKERLNYLIPET